MNKISTFISAHITWFSTIFLIVGIGFAALALFLFFYFHVAGIMKTWLYHHGIWKKHENKEARNQALTNNRDQEDYQKEISRLFTTSDNHSEGLKQKPPIKDTHEPTTQNLHPQESSDPNGANETELLKPNKPNDSRDALQTPEEGSSEKAIQHRLLFIRMKTILQPMKQQKGIHKTHPIPTSTPQIRIRMMSTRISKIHMVRRQQRFCKNQMIQRDQKQRCF